MPNPINDRTSENCTENHCSKEYAEGEWTCFLKSQPFDSEHQSRKDKRYRKRHTGKHNEVKLRSVVDEDQEELRYCIQDEADEQRELYAEFIDYEACYGQSVRQNAYGCAEKEDACFPNRHMELVDAKEQERQVVDQEDEGGQELEYENKPYFEGLLASELNVDLTHGLFEDFLILCSFALGQLLSANSRFLQPPLLLFARRGAHWFIIISHVAHHHHHVRVVHVSALVIQMITVIILDSPN